MIDNNAANLINGFAPSSPINRKDYVDAQRSMNAIISAVLWNHATPAQAKRNAAHQYAAQVRARNPSMQVKRLPVEQQHG